MSFTRHEGLASPPTAPATSTAPATELAVPAQGRTGAHGGTGVVARTEERMARMIVYARAGTAVFVFIPLFGLQELRHPTLAWVAAAAASVEAIWFGRRAWRLGTLRDPMLIAGDVVFCLLLMLVGSRAAVPGRRAATMTELVPFSLVSPAVVGFGFGLSVVAVLAVIALMATWIGSVIPDVTQKLGSDLLGFVLWYVISLLIARELRDLSRRTEQAQAEAASVARQLAEQERMAEAAQIREFTHREIHDYLLPIVDHVAAGGTADAALTKSARRGRERARRLIMDPRAPGPGFASLVADLVQTFTDQGVDLVPVISISAEPPEQIGEAVAAAAREAVRNAVRHAMTTEPVNLFVEVDEDGINVVVRDRGVGFDPAVVVAGGGLAGTYRILERHGASCEVTARPGQGTKVVIRWPAPERAAAPTPDPTDGDGDGDDGKGGGKGYGKGGGAR
jgi:signal transduction histidine kinase